MGSIPINGSKKLLSKEQKVKECDL